jgi:FdhE protein
MAGLLKDVLKTVEHYRNLYPHYGDLLDILEEILILRGRHIRNMQELPFQVDEQLINAKMMGGLPLLDLATAEFKINQPKTYFLELLGIAEKRVPEETREIIKQLEDGSLDYERLLRDSFCGEDLELIEEEQDEDTFDLISLFVEESLRPALEKVVDKYGAVIAGYEWNEGYCPVCGKEPKIGQIRDDEGGRYLYCHQCGYEWPFRRIKCPFCGNEEQQSLAYFTVEGDERYRVDVCNECKRYIKIVDFRTTEETANLDVEDIATLHLDMLANEEGYD